MGFLRWYPSCHFIVIRNPVKVSSIQWKFWWKSPKSKSSFYGNAKLCFWFLGVFSCPWRTIHFRCVRFIIHKGLSPCLRKHVSRCHRLSPMFDQNGWYKPSNIGGWLLGLPHFDSKSWDWWVPNKREMPHFFSPLGWWYMQLGSKWYTASVPEMFCTGSPILADSQAMCWSTFLYHFKLGKFPLIFGWLLPQVTSFGIPKLWLILKGTSLPLGLKSRQLALISICYSTTHLWYVNIPHLRQFFDPNWWVSFFGVCLKIWYPLNPLVTSSESSLSISAIGGTPFSDKPLLGLPSGYD